jgi:hypothetical protein
LAEDQPRAVEHPSGSCEDLSGHESESVDDPSTQVPLRLWTRKSHSSLLLQSPQILSLDQLLDQSAIGNQFLYSQSVMVINANANGFTHFPYNQWEDTTFEGTCHKR